MNEINKFMFKNDPAYILELAFKEYDKFDEVNYTSMPANIFCYTTDNTKFVEYMHNRYSVIYRENCPIRLQDVYKRYEMIAYIFCNQLFPDYDSYKAYPMFDFLEVITNFGIHADYIDERSLLSSDDKCSIIVPYYTGVYNEKNE